MVDSAGSGWPPLPHIPFFGARKVARQLSEHVLHLRGDLDHARKQMATLGILTIEQLQAKREELERDIALQGERLERERHVLQERIDSARSEEQTLRARIVETEDIALLQEAGVYHYQHPLSDAVAYRARLDVLEDQVKDMNRRDGGAILASTNWTVNGSPAEGRKMIRDFSKLMLRAFNAEADNLVRTLKPFRLAAAVERLRKVAESIQKLGKTMDIRIAGDYLSVRIRELELTADFLQKQAEEKELERVERERLREERKVQQEIERERQRLEKERQHYHNALTKLEAKGDAEAAERMREHLAEVDRAISDVDYRAANIRAGYVYVISNIGSFGERMIKVGMTRRLDPLDRIRELSDASVPFNFDVHALFFSKDAVGIETAMHERLSAHRVNRVNVRREFFHVTPGVAKEHLGLLAGELLEFQDVPEALEFRQSLTATGPADVTSFRPEQTCGS